MSIHVLKFQDSFRDELINLWERSVRATHHFLTSEDIAFFKSLVGTIDFNSFDVYCAFDDENKMAGMLGVADGKLEMLFLAPEKIGKGVGKQVMTFALNELDVNQVDVNEQNTNAIEFYAKFGFKVYGRTDRDDHDKPYPILKMRL
nr:Acetyltransferase (GNAT) domain protein [uncultured bacterium]